jgi:carboxymethylenebutenolidase
MRITLPSGTPAEITRPDGPASRGLVVIPDIGSLRPLFDDHVARLAAENGWVVCAFDLWAGRDDLATLEDRLAAGGTLADERLLGDAVAAADATGVEPVGILGFCMGGMYALKAAATGAFDRAVVFYGMIRLPEEWRGPGQGEPLDVAADACPTLAFFGDADPFTPADDLEALRAAWSGHAEHEIVVYPGAEHGFVHDPARPAHRPDAAADAWRRTLALLGVD